MTTITGREINVKSNKSHRTYTIRAEHSKYRTGQMTKQEFNDAGYWTANDWQHFLNDTCGDYYVVN